MPYSIVTKRVVVRNYEVSDAEALGAVLAANHVRLREWMPWAWDEPQSIDARRSLLTLFRTRFDAGEDFTMGMFDKDTGALLGGTGLHPRGVPDTLEIGYWLAADAEGKGIMREVASALTHVAFGLALAANVQIHCDPANTRSRRVPEALGFTLADVRPREPDAHSSSPIEEVWEIGAERIADSAIAAFPLPTIVDSQGRGIVWPE